MTNNQELREKIKIILDEESLCGWKGVRNVITDRIEGLTGKRK